jgi:transcriptional regulator with XRE-family HTH domain
MGNTPPPSRNMIKTWPIAIVEHDHAQHSFIPSAIRRYRHQRRLTLENVSGIAGMSVQHLSEIESSKRDPRLSSIERIADAMELALMLVPEHMAPDIRRYIASQGRVFTTTSSTKETSNDDPT